MNNKEILSQLERTDGEFPGEAIDAVLEKKSDIIPGLLGILEKLLTETEKIQQEDDYFGHIYAMFLLAEMREEKAFSIVIDFFALPEEITWELTGDIITVDLGRIFASLCPDNWNGLKQVVENEKLEDLVRAAALDALLILMKHEEIDRKELVNYFNALLEGKLERTNSMVWNHLTVCCVNIYPEETLSGIKKAFEEDLVDEDFITLKQVEDALSVDKEEVLNWLAHNPDYTLVDNSVKDISKWLS